MARANPVVINSNAGVLLEEKRGGGMSGETPQAGGTGGPAARSTGGAAARFASELTTSAAARLRPLPVVS